jgi:phytanoyl-CoA hydroxylase
MQYKYTSPPTALGFWIALEQCTRENGALSFLPGSHLTAPITKRFVRLPGGGTGFEQLLDPNQVSAPVGEYILEECNPGERTILRHMPTRRTASAKVALIIGDLVLIHGSVLHKSERNLSAKTRFAYTFHMIESPPFAVYDDRNWLQPTEAMPFSHILDTPNVTIREVRV